MSDDDEPVYLFPEFRAAALDLAAELRRALYLDRIVALILRTWNGLVHRGSADG